MHDLRQPVSCVERSGSQHCITDADPGPTFGGSRRWHQLGNWSDFQEDANGNNSFTDAGDLDQDRTHNDANEITGITEGGGQSAWVDASYDLAGNMGQGPAPGDGTTNLKFIYDAWNRLVAVTDNSDVTIATYEYDGLNRRIAKTDELADPDVDYDYYYDESWRVLEVRKDADTDPLHQYVWQPPGVYIDALAIDYYDANTDNADIEELYATFDANMNVTALVDDGGTVLERYEYDAYGQPTVLDADFSADADGVSDYENEVLFGGYRYDPESGLYHVRNRMLHPSLGRWMQRDPAGYVDGMSLYALLSENPVRLLDPTGAIPQDPGWTRWPGMAGNPSYEDLREAKRRRKEEADRDALNRLIQDLKGICDSMPECGDCTKEICYEEAETIANLYLKAVREIRNTHQYWKCGDATGVLDRMLWENQYPERGVYRPYKCWRWAWVEHGQYGEWGNHSFIVLGHMCSTCSDGTTPMPNIILDPWPGMHFLNLCDNWDLAKLNWHKDIGFYHDYHIFEDRGSGFQAYRNGSCCPATGGGSSGGGGATGTWEN